MMQLYVFQTMDPCSPAEQDNLRPQKFTDHELDELLQDLNEFERTVSMQGPGNVTSVGDFVDSFLTGGINYNDAHSLQCHLTKVLRDFEEYETKVLPPSQRDSPATNNLHNAQTFTFAAEIQDSQAMIEEMAQGTQDLLIENFPLPTPGLNMTSHILSCCSLGGTSCLGIDSFVSSTGGVSFNGRGSLNMSSFGSSSVRYFHCMETGSGNEKANIRRRRKRKYKGVIETEEETARRLERTKIKNREAAAKAHQKKQAHEANLKTKLLRLRKKNQFLKNLLMFLEDDKRKAASPKPLKRTNSGPM